MDKSSLSLTTNIHNPQNNQHNRPRIHNKRRRKRGSRPVDREKRKRRRQSHTHCTVHRILRLFRQNPNRLHPTHSITNQRNNHHGNKKHHKRIEKTKTTPETTIINVQTIQELAKTAEILAKPIILTRKPQPTLTIIDQNTIYQHKP